MPRALPAGAVMLSSVVTIAGEFETAVRTAIGDAVIVEDFETARGLARDPVAPRRDPRGRRASRRPSRRRRRQG